MIPFVRFVKIVLVNHARLISQNVAFHETHMRERPVL